jgi:hypothetical protein
MRRKLLVCIKRGKKLASSQNCGDLIFGPTEFPLSNLWSDELNIPGLLDLNGDLVVDEARDVYGIDPEELRDRRETTCIYLPEAIPNSEGDPYERTKRNPDCRDEISPVGRPAAG